VFGPKLKALPASSAMRVYSTSAPSDAWGANTSTVAQLPLRGEPALSRVS
jgi:hypothetical protein